MKEARRQLVYEVVKRTRRGESQRGIARALEIAPRTVKRILAREEGRRSGGESALERELPAAEAKLAELRRAGAASGAGIAEFPVPY